MSNGNNGNSGNSGNSKNGTETSFTKTPQAKDDALGTPQTGKLNYVNSVYMLDVMSNDLGGNAKSLWSIDDGINNSGAMSGAEAGDLLTQDAPGDTGLPANRSLFGAALHVTADGRVAYDTATIDLAHAVALTGLALGETLTDSFIYAIRLGNGTLSWAKATVVLTGVNDTPVVQSVSLAAIEDGGPVTGSFDGDDVDSDDDGNSLIYNIIGSPDAGTLTNNGDGTFTFAPGAAFQTLAVGQTTDINLTYTATDKHGAVSAPADLAVTVTGVNDAPIAAPDTGETDADTVVTLDVLVNDTDIDDGDVLTISSASSGSGGTVQIINNELVFDPRDQFNHLIKGQLEDVILTYSVSDGNGGSDTATVTVTVEGTNTPPDAIDDEVSIPEENGVVVAVLDNDIDPDPGEILTVTNVAVLSGGGSAAIVNDGHGNGIKVSWLPGLTPAPHSDSAPGHDESDPGHHDSSELIPLHDTLGAGETAEVTLEYTIKDRFDVTDTATVTITVTGENDVPVAHADSGSTEENQILLLDVLANDTDIDTNDTRHLEFANITQGAGTAAVDSNLLRWAPGSDYDYLNLGESATVEIDYTITDNSGAESSSTATITVTGNNDAPIAQADAGSTTENAALTLDVLANDIDVDANDTRTLKTVTAAAGSASIVSNELVWNPGAAFDYLTAGESVTTHVNYSMSDQHGAISEATATITVTGTNDSPIAVTDAVTINENAEAIVIDVLANDTDPDSSDTLGLQSVNFASGGGTATIVANQLQWDQGADFDYLAAGESATVTGSYTLSDGHISVTGQVEVIVNGVNDAPLAVPDVGQTRADSILLLDVLENDSDRDVNDVLTITEGSSTSGGQVSVVGNKLQFDPDGQFGHLVRGQEEDVTLVYSISDGNGGIDTNTATVTVTGINTVPIAVDDTAQVGEDVTVVQVAVLDNDIDPDPGEVLQVTQVNVLSGGGTAATDGTSITWANSGAFDYLSANQSATVTLGYTVADDFASDQATVTLSVVGSNDIPQVASSNSAASITELYNVSGSSTQHQKSGSFNFSDVDIADAHSVTVTAAGGSYRGALTASVANAATGDGNGTISWNYAVADSALDNLKEGQVLEQNYTITLTDGNGGTTSHAVGITLNGNFDNGDVAAGNQAPVALDNNLFSVNYDLTGYTLNPGNGHYYKYVPSSVEWSQARAAADAAGGYLVTVTSAQENTFVDNLAPSRIWMGGSDPTSVDSWSWNTGPESGTQFWSGGTTGYAPGGRYQNWASQQQQQPNYSEPNNINGGTEHYGEMLLGTDWNGQWNDHPNYNDGQTGYVVEISQEVYDWYWTDTQTSVDPFNLDTDWNYDTQVYTPAGWTRNPDNGHYYKYVTGTLSWTQAAAAAAAQGVSDITPGEGSRPLTVFQLLTNSHPGNPATFTTYGHLVTITSEAENDFVANLVGSGRVWIGASDAGSEGAWKWTTGPENGTQFWSGATSGSAVSGRYENWRSTMETVTVRTEPNDHLGVVEDYLEMRPGGAWNDTPPDTGGIRYVIEIGGRPGDPDMPNLFVPNEDETVTIAGADLLANDFDADGDPITITAVSPTTAGGATLTLTGSPGASNRNVIFNPGDAYQHLAQGDTATDTFNYTIYDGPTRGSYDTAQVTVTVTGINDAPVATNDAGSTKQETALFLNVLANDSDIDDGDVLQLVTGTTQSDEGSAVLASANGDVRYAAQSATLTALGEGQTLVDNFSYTVKDILGSTDTGTVAVTVTGINDRPVAVTDHASGSEEAIITGNVIANDYDPDNGDSISMVTTGTITSVKGASVVLNNDGSFSYTGPHNFSGADSFNYSITDSYGLQRTGTANITVVGVADAPTVSIANVGAAAKFNEFSVAVTAGLTDTTEAGSFVFTGLPAGVKVYNQQGQNVTTTPISFFGNSQVQTFTVELPEDQSSNFNLGVTATSTEQGTTSSASVSASPINVVMSVNSQNFSQSFSAAGQSMWGSGAAATLEDHRFLGLETPIDFDFSEGVTIPDPIPHIHGSLGTPHFHPIVVFGETVGYEPIPHMHGATPLTTHWHDIDVIELSADVDLDLRLGLQSDLVLDGGTVNAQSDFVVDVSTSYNRPADILTFTTSAGLATGAFETFSPSATYNLDFIFDLNGTARADIESVVGDTNLFNANINSNNVVDIFDFDSATDINLSFTDPTGILTFDISFPSINTNSANLGGGAFSSSGASNNFMQLTADVDQAVAAVVGAVFGIPPTNAINPFDLSYSVLGGAISAGIELLDFDLTAGTNFIQNFNLNIGDLKGTIVFTEHATAQTLDFDFGDTLTINNASVHDLNNDGNIEYFVLMDPEASLRNDTDLGFNVGWNLDLVKASAGISTPIYDESLDFGPVYNVGDTVPVTTVGILDSTFALDFAAQQSGMLIA